MNPTPPSPPSPTKIIYLAGPMQGIPQFNFPRFHSVARILRNSGHTVFSPAEKDIERHGGVDLSKGNAFGSLAQAKSEHGFSLREALAQDCEFICLEANCVVFLPGWESSKGAMAEHRLATALIPEGMELVYMHEDDCQLVEMMEIVDGAKEARNAA